MSTEFIDPYLLPGSSCLKNLLRIVDHVELGNAEYDITLARRQTLSATVADGGFDLAHLQQIHHHLFQDIFAWAGEIRTVNIQKRDSMFQPVSAIEIGAQFTFRQLHDGPLLAQAPISDSEFVVHMSTLFEQMNYLHPFREGNGRTQRAFLDLVAAQRGRRSAWRNVSQREHIQASIECFNAGSGKPYEWIFARVIQAPHSGFSPLDDGMYVGLDPFQTHAPGTGNDHRTLGAEKDSG